MTRPGGLDPFHGFDDLVQDCRENAALFWYRIQWDASAIFRRGSLAVSNSREGLAPIPVSLRLKPVCSNQSATYFIRSTMSKQ